MLAIPSPPGSVVLGGRDRTGRALRVTAHPEAGRVVVSTWQEDTCAATVRLAPGDVPDLVRALSAAAVACAHDAGVSVPDDAAGLDAVLDRSGAASGVSAA